MPDSFYLSGFFAFIMKTIIVVGASKGIGKEIALKFKRNNYNVIATYLTSYNDALILKEKGIDIYKVDICSSLEVKGLFEYAIEKYKKSLLK